MTQFNTSTGFSTLTKFHDDQAFIETYDNL